MKKSEVTTKKEGKKKGAKAKVPKSLRKSPKALKGTENTKNG